MTATIRPCTVAEITGNRAFPALRAEYAAASALAGLPDPAEKLAAYALIERGGAFQAYGAFLPGGALIGFVAVLAPVIPHYGIAIAVTESLFVSRPHRGTGAGLGLIRAAEAHAHRIGSPALLISAPSAGALVRILPRLGYHETNRVFMKGVRP